MFAELFQVGTGLFANSQGLIIRMAESNVIFFP